MNPAILTALAGLGIGGVKWLNDRNREKEDRQMQALETYLSPWLAMSGNMQPRTQVHESDFAGTVLGSALQGADFGMKNQGMLSKLGGMGGAAPAAKVQAPVASAASATPSGAPQGLGDYTLPPMGVDLNRYSKQTPDLAMLLKQLGERGYA